MIRIERNKELTTLHTFHLKGAVAAYYAEFDSPGDLTALLSDTSLPRPIFVIGGGSNLIFNGRFDGTVIRCHDRQLLQNSPCTFTVGAGVMLDDICCQTTESGLWGAENLSAISGEIGGAIVQNAGAYGAEIADIVTSVDVYDMATSQFLTFTREECHFAYRHSIFKEQPRYIILSAQLHLHTSRQTLNTYKGLDIPFDASPMQVRQAVIGIRDAKLPDPAITGSAGSFFKNPIISISKLNELQTMHPGEHIPTYAIDGSQVKIPAAWLIDRCGLNGFEMNGVQVWPSQPLVLVNKSGNATAADVMAMAHTVHDTVATHYGIELTHEVVYVSSLPLQ